MYEKKQLRKILKNLYDANFPYTRLFWARLKSYAFLLYALLILREFCLRVCRAWSYCIQKCDFTLALGLSFVDDFVYMSALRWLVYLFTCIPVNCTKFRDETDYSGNDWHFGHLIQSSKLNCKEAQKKPLPIARVCHPAVHSRLISW